MWSLLTLVYPQAPRPTSNQVPYKKSNKQRAGILRQVLNTYPARVIDSLVQCRGGVLDRKGQDGAQNSAKCERKDSEAVHFDVGKSVKNEDRPYGAKSESRDERRGAKDL